MIRIHLVNFFINIFDFSFSFKVTYKPYQDVDAYKNNGV